MFAPVSKVVLCPISMTDGAVRVLELFGTEKQKKEIIPKLCSTDPKQAWTAGQWMTERPGGSDVSRTETTARPLNPNKKPEAGDAFVISGFKWFSSATDGDISLALARTSEDLKLGSKGLSLFLIKIRDDKTGKLNGIRVHRLKKKLGTKYLPTAELELDGCIGELVGEIGRGVATISSVLNITRLYSAGGAVGAISWGLRSATAYAQIRPALSVVENSINFPYTRINSSKSPSSTASTSKSSSPTSSSWEPVKLVKRPNATHNTFATFDASLESVCRNRGTEAYLTLIESSTVDKGIWRKWVWGDVARFERGEDLGRYTGDSFAGRVESARPIERSSFVGVLRRHRCHPLFSSAKLTTALGGEIKFLGHVLRETGTILSSLNLERHMKTNDLRFSRYLLDLLMAIHGSALLLQQASWKATTFAQSQELQNLAGVKATDEEMAQDVQVIKLWIGGADGVAGFADLARLLTQLKAAATEEGGRAASDVKYWVIRWCILGPRCRSAKEPFVELLRSLSIAHALNVTFFLSCYLCNGLDLGLSCAKSVVRGRGIRFEIPFQPCV